MEAAAVVSKSSEKAYRSIRERILSGTFEQGMHLKEEELAVICGVSRTPIRDALRKLAADDYVRIVPNHGTFVSSWSDDDIDEIFHLRAIIEAYGARRVAERASADEIDGLTECCDAIESELEKGESFDKDTFFAANRRFHQILREAGQSERLAATLNRLVEQPVVMRTVISYTLDDFARSNRHHREIVEAITARDGDWAEAIMRSHIHAAYQVYQRAYGRDGGDSVFQAELRRD